MLCWGRKQEGKERTWLRIWSNVNFLMDFSVQRVRDFLQEIQGTTETPFWIKNFSDTAGTHWQFSGGDSFLWMASDARPCSIQPLLINTLKCLNSVPPEAPWEGPGAGPVKPLRGSWTSVSAVGRKAVIGWGGVRAMWTESWLDAGMHKQRHRSRSSQWALIWAGFSVETLTEVQFCWGSVRFC